MLHNVSLGVIRNNIKMLVKINSKTQAQSIIQPYIINNIITNLVEVLLTKSRDWPDTDVRIIRWNFTCASKFAQVTCACIGVVRTSMSELFGTRHSTKSLGLYSTSMLGSTFLQLVALQGVRLHISLLFHILYNTFYRLLQSDWFYFSRLSEGCKVIG